ERAARAHYLLTHHPALLKAIERAASYKSKLRARLTLEQKLLKAKGVKFRWSKTDWLYVGNWGFDCCQQALPAVFITREDGSDTVPAIADEAWGTAVLMATQQMIRHPIHTPTLRPPEQWGWFTNDLGVPFLHSCRDEEAAKAAIVSNQMRPHLDAISYLQGVAYRIDGYMLDFIQALARWRDVPLINITRSHRDCGPRRLLDWDLTQAEFLRHEIFYIPLNCEWRGRV